MPMGLDIVEGAELEWKERASEKLLRWREKGLIHAVVSFLLL